MQEHEAAEALVRARKKIISRWPGSKVTIDVKTRFLLVEFTLIEHNEPFGPLDPARHRERLNLNYHNSWNSNSFADEKEPVTALCKELYQRIRTSRSFTSSLSKAIA